MAEMSEMSELSFDLGIPAFPPQHLNCSSKTTHAQMALFSLELFHKIAAQEGGGNE